MTGSVANLRRSNFAVVYLPSFFFELGLSVIMPIIPLVALEFGALEFEAALMTFLLFVGQVVGDIPAGTMATLIGEKKMMLIGVSASIIIYIIAMFNSSALILGVLMFFLGMINAIFLLARQSYLTAVTPETHRGRAMSALGAVHRIGALIGPFLGAGIVFFFGSRGAFGLALGFTVINALLLLWIPDIKTPKDENAMYRHSSEILRDSYRMFFTLGIGAMMVGAVRTIYRTAMPLWCNALGFSDSLTSLLYGFGGLIDVLAIYPAAKLIDFRGRLAAGLPALTVTTIAFIALPFTHDLWSALIVIALFGLGNGFSTGIVMVYGADLAPPAYRAKFLGIWRLITDAGQAIGPLGFSGVVGLIGLAGGIFSGAFAAVFGMLMLGIFGPKFAPRTSWKSASKPSKLKD
jgi:MFS family permease